MFQAISKQKVSGIAPKQDCNLTKNSIKLYPNLQAKLKISQPGDIYEQEADKIAEQVISISSPQVNRKCTRCEKENEEEMKISRKSNSESNFEVSDEIANGINNIRSGGSSFDQSTRDFMESRFGFDFSKVRIHTDDKAARTAESVNALAYTVGNDIVFGTGQYSPGTKDGQRLLAHELTHVVQQHKLYTDLSVLRPIEVHQYSKLGFINRYQAGERGHGGIEEEGLRSAGFSGDMGSGDIGAIYFGNWLRDWSQVVVDKQSVLYSPVMAILNIISMGEFNRPVSSQDLGGYLPSEHMDNPLGGVTPESSDNDTLEARRESLKAEEKLSTTQKIALFNERSLQLEKIEVDKKNSGLPDYIERGKEHAKDKISQSIRVGIDTPENKTTAMMYLGDALHVVEDYYSHSNFTEVALDILAHGNNPAVKRAARAVLAQAIREIPGFNAVTAGDIDKKLGDRHQIVTGTYGSESHGANKVVSMIEQLKSEVLTGALRLAFIKGMARITGKSVGSVTRVGGEIILGPASAVEGTVTGMGSGIVKGFEEGHGFVGTVENMIAEAGHGAVSGAKSGVELAGDVGQGIGTVAGDVIGGAVGTGLIGMASPLFAALDAAVHANMDKWLADERTVASAKGAPGGSPTHSQLAKDAPEHPIYPTSRALAVYADTMIGFAMRENAWKNPDKDKAIFYVNSLIDKLIAHPKDNQDIWEKPLKEALRVS